jgi:simple sugar transport system permease protein
MNLRNKLTGTRVEVANLVVLAAVFAVFFIGAPEVFFRFNIYYSFMSTIPAIGMLALSVTFVVVLGEMDLSFPSVFALASWVLGTVFQVTGSLGLGVILALVAGTLAGLINTIFVVRIGIPSLVGTIGAMFFWRGLVNVLASGEGISLAATQGSFLHQVFVGRIAGVVPAQMVWFVALGIIFYIILNRHRFGSHLLFVGDNPRSAHMMGINVNRVKTIAFMQTGFFAALVGVISTLEVTYFWPSQGQGFLLTALAAVFVGGTSVFGGTGSILGTFTGALVIGSLEAGIIAIGLSGFWTQLVYGFIIMASVSVYTVLLRHRR